MTFYFPLVDDFQYALECGDRWKFKWMTGVSFNKCFAVVIKYRALNTVERAIYQ